MNEEHNERFEMTDGALEEFAEALAGMTPIAPAVKSGEVMFQAGVELANRQHDSAVKTSRQRTKLWQLATACSLLIMAASLSGLLPSNSPNQSLAEDLTNPKIESPADQKQTPTQDDSTKSDAPKAGDEFSPFFGNDAALALRQQQHSETMSFFGIENQSSNPAAQRRTMLFRGLAGLPELKMASTSAGPSGFELEDPISPKTFMKNLLRQRESNGLSPEL